MRRTGPTNYVLRRTIRQLRKAARINKARIWRYVAELLERPTRKRIAVNIYKIDRLSREGDVIVVPGKVLGVGKLSHRVTIAAIAFSRQAIEKIKAVNGRAIHVLELVNENPRGSGVKVII
uniref:Large ribosomal subunit protein eL18 n=1 Tax=Ignisphaera aggregans TaxID=334771 RepID=A0A7J3Z6U2_9CREN